MVSSVKDLELGVFGATSLIGSSYFRIALDKCFFLYFLQDENLIAFFLNGFRAFFSTVIFFFYLKRFIFFHLCILVGFSYACFTHLQFLTVNQFGFTLIQNEFYEVANTGFNILYSSFFGMIGFYSLMKFRSEYPTLFSRLGGKT